MAEIETPICRATSASRLLLARGLISVGGGHSPCYTTEDQTSGDARAANVVVVEGPQDIPSGIEARYDVALSVEDLSVAVYLQASKAHGNAAGYRIGNERRGIDLQCPVGLSRLDSLGALAVKNARIEFALLHGGIEILDSG